MDLQAIASGMDQSRAATTVSNSVLHSVQNLTQDTTARLLSTMGIGNNVNASA